MANNLLQVIYDELFKVGITVIYGRPGVGKSRLSYSIAEVYNPYSLLVIPHEDAERNNIHPDVTICNLDDCRSIIKIIHMLNSKVAIVDSVSRIKSYDLLANRGKLKRMCEREKIRLIFTAQVRTDITKGGIYAHNCNHLISDTSTETINMVANRKETNFIESVLLCKTSGKRIAIPIPRNKTLTNDDVFEYLTNSYAKDYNEAKKIVESSLRLSRKNKSEQRNIIRWR